MSMRTSAAIAAGIVSVLVMAGCVRSSVDRLTPDTAMINAKGGAQYDMGDIQRELLLQAANVTLESGYDYFTITSADGGYATSNVIVPGTATTQTNFNAYGAGNSIYGTATTNTYGTPTQSFSVQKPRGAMMIKMGRGAPPAGDPNSFDAREIKAFAESQ
jgi:hypothetical protein